MNNLKSVGNNNFGIAEGRLGRIILIEAAALNGYPCIGSRIIAVEGTVGLSSLKGTAVNLNLCILTCINQIAVIICGSADLTEVAAVDNDLTVCISPDSYSCADAVIVLGVYGIHIGVDGNLSVFKSLHCAGATVSLHILGDFMSTGLRAEFCENGRSFFIIHIIEAVVFNRCLGSVDADAERKLCCPVRIFVFRICLVSDFGRHINYHCICFGCAGVKSCTDNALLTESLKGIGHGLNGAYRRCAVFKCGSGFHCTHLYEIAEKIKISRNIFSFAFIDVA